MPESNIEQARSAVYLQERQVEALRREFYERAGGAPPQGLSTLLKGAEKELEARRTKLRAESDPGAILISTQAPAGPGGVRLGGDTTGLEVSVKLRQARVPTGIIHLLDPEKAPLVSIAIKNKGEEKTRIRISSVVDGYSAEAVNCIELAAGESIEIPQLPIFYLEKLRTVTELTRASLRVAIRILGFGAKASEQTEQENSFPIWLLARTSAYNWIRDPTSGDLVDLRPYFAAWVTPNAPEILTLLRRAADLTPDGMIYDYQGRTPESVQNVVKAVFDALKGVGITYINSVISFGAGEGEMMQRVRLPRECLAERSANCIDGTLLFASILEAASINPGLVFVPGHAFLAWETGPDSGNWDYLETTKVGTSSFDEAHEFAQSEATRDPEHLMRYSIADLRTRLGITPLE